MSKIISQKHANASKLQAGKAKNQVDFSIFTFSI